MIAEAEEVVKPSSATGHLEREIGGAPVRGGGVGGGCQRARTMPDTLKPLYGNWGSLHCGFRKKPIHTFLIFLIQFSPPPAAAPARRRGQSGPLPGG